MVISSPLDPLRFSCDCFMVTYSVRGSLDERKIGSDAGVSRRRPLMGLE